MKRTLTMLLIVLVLTGCASSNGNSILKLETTIYKTLTHDELAIEDGFTTIKKIFTDKDSFYHASLLTLEYGVDGTSELEENVKNETNSYDVLYLTFSFETGNVRYENMKSNYVYKYQVYLVKSYKDDIWHVYKMDELVQ